MPAKPDDFEKKLELQKSDVKELKSSLVAIDTKITKMITLFGIIQIFIGLLIILIIAYFIFKYY
jgi:hypothetical protein